MLPKEDSELLELLSGSSNTWTSPFLISSLELSEDSISQFLDFFFKDAIYFYTFFSVQIPPSEADEVHADSSTKKRFSHCNVLQALAFYIEVPLSSFFKTFQSAVSWLSL